MNASNRATRRCLVIAGNGMVGHRLVELLLDSCAAEAFDIHVFGEEHHPAYDRVQLTSYLADATLDDLRLGEPDLYDRPHLRRHLGDPVVAIDRERGVVSTRAGATLAYDELVLATGSYPFVPPVAGVEGAGRFVYRTLEDLDAIRDYAARCHSGAVIGGGLLGLEAAKALSDLGLSTHVVEFAPRLMPMQLDDIGGMVLRRKIEALGLAVHVNSSATHVVGTADGVRKVRFADGREIATDMVVFSAGIRPRDELARDAGLEVGARGGIVVDDRCRTSDEHIHALGECAVWQGQVFGLVNPGYAMARVVAAQLAGEDARFEGADLSTKLKLMGVDVVSLGDAFGRAEGSHAVAVDDGAAGVYKKLVVSADSKRLLGAMLVGDASDWATLTSYVDQGLPLPATPAALIVAGGGAVPTPELGDAAQVCSCNGVDKGTLCRAVREGCKDLGTLKRETRVATGCGGCAPLVQQLLARELTSMGEQVSRDLCEHFPHTRQELYHLVRTQGIESFSELLARHGRGRGCEICKPTVASILASTNNAHVLGGERATLQDTNDCFLANIQRDGTYSVVPRVPGGEITPDALIALGQVAKKHGLYTKITGGQRVDLFGARVEQLPQIWRELIDAGFESGHAYGKAMRTVKSCVGSTWCRYGVQDSVAMAIRLELRYRGLRAPHKLKSAVSGCTRECAEAQSKDFGVIATEKGYNLYVCGNGGMKPAHAKLLATDLDADTLVRTIDRFLMFYIRTADRLQRTATWFAQLEGGLDYLKQVIVEDSLGICAELEADMDLLVRNYACEWRETLEDPEKLRRFRSFVNADSPDPDIQFVREREQIRPVRLDERAPDAHHLPVLRQ